MKRIISIVLAMIIACCSFSAMAYSINNQVSGDVDGNGVLNINDATAIQKYLVEKETFVQSEKFLADVDLNERVNIMDVTNIQRALVGSMELPDSNIDGVQIYFKNNRNWSKVYFYVYNSKTDTAKTKWPGELITETVTGENGTKLYTAFYDTKKYDRIIFTNGSEQTINATINKATSGFSVSSGNTGGKYWVDNFAFKGASKGKLVTTTLPYPTGYNKKIWVWTPAGYDANSTKKYKTVYMTDGQNLFDGNPTSFGDWGVSESVESLMCNSYEGMILVGIDNGTYTTSNDSRDRELTPDIGPVVPNFSYFSVRNGEQFSDFVVEQVMPYVRENFNSSERPEDNFVAGSSSGGLEAFYIGMEHKDKFSGIGAISPAFLLFTDESWRSYLSKYDFKSEMPKLYIFNGNGDNLEQQLYVESLNMYNRLLELGYDKDRITFVAEEAFSHNEAHWRANFPDMLTWLLGI